MLNKKLKQYYENSPWKGSVLCWYPFEHGASALDLSGGVLTDLLRRQCARVSSDAAMGDESFDYVVVLDPEDFSVEALSNFKKISAPHGRLLLAYENPFALRYWSGKRSPVTGMPYDSFFGYGAGVCKAELSLRLKLAGFDGQKWYYPLTDHWFTREVYSESYLPDEYLNQRFRPYITDDPELQFDEIGLYREAIRGGAFEFMCGAYLVEARVCGRDEPCVVDYAAVTAYREPAKRFATTLRSDGKVLKIALHPDGKATMANILRNHEELAGLGINIIPIKHEGETIIMPRLEFPTIWDYWAKKLINGTFDENEMFFHFDRIREVILKAAATGKCFWELVPANCFFDVEKDELIFFDQEYYWDDVSPDVAVARAILALKFSPVFVEDPRTEEWLERLKTRYGLAGCWEELSELADVKIFTEVFGGKTCRLEIMTEHSKKLIYERAAATRRYWKFYPVVNILDSLGFKKPAIYGFDIRGQTLLDILTKNNIEIAALLDQRFEHGKSIETSLSKAAADVVIVSIQGGEGIAKDLQERLRMPVYTLEELLDWRVEQAPKRRVVLSREVPKDRRIGESNAEHLIMEGRKMQGKVSIVIPCYNKANYIGATLDSIIAQEWDDVEIILVNDGSTDGTREIIAAYEPKFFARGYEAVIIDQENKGACTAVKAGLERVGGKYVCLIDADDELDPQYASTMAKWLEEHDEYDYCSCDYIEIKYENGIKHKNSFTPHLWPEETYSPEFFLCNDLSKAAWAFMVRKSYIEKCRLVETFYADTRGSYEPSFLIPLTIYGGKMKHFNFPLYYYSCDVGGLSQDREFEKKNKYWREYHRVVLLMLDRMPENILDKYKKKHLKALSSFYTLKILLLISLWTRGGKEMTEIILREFLAYVNNLLPVTPPISYDEARNNLKKICQTVELALCEMLPVPPARIIGYGALGRAAAKRLPALEGSVWQPTELWDKAGDGVAVKKPDFTSLDKNDMVIVFPTTQSIIDEMSGELERSGAKVFYNKEINDLLYDARFPR